MRLSLKTQQVLGFALLAGVGALLLGAWYVQSLLTMRLEETQLRAQFIADALFQRTFDVMIEGREPFAVPTDSGMQTIMQTSLLSKDVLYAAITDPNGVVLAHADPARIGEVLPPVDELRSLIDQGMIATTKTIRAMSDAGAGPADAGGRGVDRAGAAIRGLTGRAACPPPEASRRPAPCRAGRGRRGWP